MKIDFNNNIIIEKEGNFSSSSLYFFSFIIFSLFHIHLISIPRKIWRKKIIYLFYFLIR